MTKLLMTMTWLVSVVVRTVFITVMTLKLLILVRSAVGLDVLLSSVSVRRIVRCPCVSLVLLMLAL